MMACEAAEDSFTLGRCSGRLIKRYGTRDLLLGASASFSGASEALPRLPSLSGVPQSPSLRPVPTATADANGSNPGSAGSLPELHRHSAPQLPDLPMALNTAPAILGRASPQPTFPLRPRMSVQSFSGAISQGRPSPSPMAAYKAEGDRCSTPLSPLSPSHHHRPPTRASSCLSLAALTPEPVQSLQPAGISDPTPPTPSRLATRTSQGLLPPPAAYRRATSGGLGATLPTRQSFPAPLRLPPPVCVDEPTSHHTPQADNSSLLSPLFQTGAAALLDTFPPSAAGSFSGRMSPAPASRPMLSRKTGSSLCLVHLGDKESASQPSTPTRAAAAAPLASPLGSTQRFPSLSAGGLGSTGSGSAAVLPDNALVVPDWKSMYWGPVVDRPEADAHAKIVESEFEQHELPARALLGRTVSRVRAVQRRAELEEADRRVCEEELSLLTNQTLAL